MCINQIKNKGFHVTNFFMYVFSYSLYDIQVLLSRFQHTNFFHIWNSIFSYFL